MNTPPTESVYNQVGGIEFFVELVDRFYDGVENDPVLRPLYPDDLGPGKQALAYFLAQYWGGPTTYSDAKGHPRLRMRHMPFRITRLERDRWFVNMVDALDALDVTELDPALHTQMTDYFAMAADHLINAE